MTNEEIADRIEALILERVTDGNDANKGLTLAAKAIRTYDGDVREYLAGKGELPPEVRGEWPQRLQKHARTSVEQAVWGVDIAQEYRKGAASGETRYLPQSGELTSRQRTKKK